MADELYAAALIFPQEFSDVVSKLREKYKQYMTYTIVPHVTLIYPFRPTINIDAVNYNLEEAAKRTKPFTMILHGIEYFETGNNVAYVAIENKQPVKDLHANLVRSVSRLIKEEYTDGNYNIESFIPHVTIGAEIPEDIFPAVKREYSNYEIHHESKIVSFSLFSDNEVGNWEVSRVFVLAG